jgi:glyoxylase-like metal-dependent hydrolase (beta-lactamase superfamily II)
MNRRLRIGSYEIACVQDTPFGVDGGAMFGMVPKVRWEKKCTSDHANRVFIALNCLLVRGEGKTILLDAGIGNKLNEKQRGYYGLDSSVSLLKSLEAEGVAPSDVDIVAASHLHLDHAGWLTMRGDDGKLRPTFPNAEVYIQKTEWEFAHNGNELTSGSYMRDDFDLFADTAVIVDGKCDISSGIRLEMTGAHTPGHQLMKVASGGDMLLCPADILPTTWQLRLTWVSGFDLDPAAVVDVKKKLMAEAAENGWIVFLDHEPGDCFGRLERVSDKDYDWHAVG